VSGEVTLSGENSEKPLDGQGSELRWGNSQRLPDPVACGEGLLPLPRNPTPAVGLRSCPPNEKSWARPWTKLAECYTLCTYYIPVAGPWAWNALWHHHFRCFTSSFCNLLTIPLC